MTYPHKLTAPTDSTACTTPLRRHLLHKRSCQPARYIMSIYAGYIHLTYIDKISYLMSDLTKKISPLAAQGFSL